MNINNFSFRQNSEYWNRAFDADFYNIWREAPYQMQHWDYNEMSASWALKCFHKSAPEYYVGRQILFKEYFEPNLTKIKSAEWDKLELPTHTILPKLVKNSIGLYNDCPNRSFGDADDILSEIYKASNFELIMPEIYETAKVVGTVMIEPVFNDNILTIDYYTPDQFRVVNSKTNRNKIEKIILPMQSDDNPLEFLFQVWTEESMQVWKNGRIIEEVENIYGKLPFVFLHLGNMEKASTNLSWGDISLVTRNLEINLEHFFSKMNLIYQGLPITIFTNPPENFNGVISPGEVITDETDDPDDVGSMINYIQPAAVYSELNEYAQTLINQELSARDISIFSSDNLSGMSGTAYSILKQPMITMRKMDLVKMTRVETELANMIYLIWCSGSNTNYNPNLVNFAISYIEEQPFSDPIAERAEDKLLVEEFMMSPLNYWRKWSNYDANISEDDLLLEIKKNVELFNKIKEITNPTPIDTAPDGPTINASEQTDEPKSPSEILSESMETEEQKLEKNQN